MCAQPWIADVRRIISSGETKALETAAVVALAIGRAIEIRHATHENDRSGTGFVPGAEFEQLADAFFATPSESIQGWESADHAQQRIVSATADLFAPAGTDVLIVGHGGVGTLLLCHLLGVPITRSEDQTGGDAAPGGGNFWSYDLTNAALLHRWRPIDAN